MLGFSLVAGGSAGVVACGGHTSSTAQNEANKANGKTVGLNDTKTTTYENKTVAEDATAIKNAMAKMPGMGTIAQDFSFVNSKKPLIKGTNKVAYNVKAKDGSTANGSFNVNIQAAPGPKPKPGPQPKPGPKVTPGEAVLTPATPSKAQAEANKVNGKTVDLKDFWILGHPVVSYENKTAAQDA